MFSVHTSRFVQVTEEPFDHINIVVSVFIFVDTAHLVRAVDQNYLLIKTFMLMYCKM